MGFWSSSADRSSARTSWTGRGRGWSKNEAGGVAAARAPDWTPDELLFNAHPRLTVDIRQHIVDGTMWQDSARTTLVEADGDPVGSIEYDTGVYMVQGSSTVRPTYHTAEVDGKQLHWIEPDGVNDHLEIDRLLMDLTIDSWQSYGWSLEDGVSTSENLLGAWSTADGMMFTVSTATRRMQAIANIVGQADLFPAESIINASQNYTHVFRYDRSVADVKIYRDGTQSATSSGTAGDLEPVTVQYELFSAANGHSTRSIHCKLYAMMWNISMSTEQRNLVETWLEFAFGVEP